MRSRHLLLCFAAIAFNLSPAQSASGSRPAPENDQSIESGHGVEECTPPESTVQSAHVSLDEVAALDAFQAHLPRNVDDAQQDTLYTATNPHIQRPYSDSESPLHDADNSTSEPDPTANGIRIEISVGFEERNVGPLPAPNSNHYGSPDLNHAENATQALSRLETERTNTSLTSTSNPPPPAVLNVSRHVSGACNSTQKLRGEHFTSGNKVEEDDVGNSHQDSWSGTWPKAPAAISALGAIGAILALSPDRKRKRQTSEGPDGSNKSEKAKPNGDINAQIDRKKAKLEDQTLQEAVEQDKVYQRRSMSSDRLVAEVKGIYVGLTMVEAKCIEVDNAQTESDRELNNEQWQALIALHRTLLHDYHDFFLASQHPSASPSLRRAASNYQMPARMWRHGIHAFLELLRHRLPHSLEHMLTFIYLAFKMMALLHETVPAFENVWTECLGDLARYRMAIENHNINDREVWTRISRYWYSRASYIKPCTGRLYHHLAIICRRNPFKELLYYTKSLCAPIPFLSAKQSIMTMPMFGHIPTHLSSLDATFLQAHAILFTRRDYENFNGVIESFLQCLEDDQSQLEGITFMTSRHPLALITCNSLLGYGDEKRILLPAENETDSACDTEETIGKSDDEIDTVQLKQLGHACILAERIDTTLMLRVGDPDILEYLHVRLIFMLQMAHDPSAMNYLENRFPWDLATMCLNAVAMSIPSAEPMQTDSFPKQSDGNGHVLSEDWEMRGLFWTENYFPVDWFANEVDFHSVVDGYKQPTPAMYREQRVLFVGRCLAQSAAPISFNPELNLSTSTLEEPLAMPRPIPWQATSPGSTEVQNNQASTTLNTAIKVHMASMNEIDNTLIVLDTEEAAESSLIQNTSLTKPERGVSQPIVEESGVATITSKTLSVGTSTEMTSEALSKAPQGAMNCVVPSESTEVTSTPQTDENIIDATTSKSCWTKINSLTPISYPESLGGKNRLIV
ncbi:hypothetical protein B0J13DRAFT_132685 [Dactylonectria estremocensis]|uniref:Nonsense-mediated mRNA decay factor n=1 Tax=Dactylonectria estremocensis TaxID=1079267 RepID=A0A9P9E0A4_9HYPO|nr:hypothetical protein B0J13DRAFT_132685 [Dactylonectria estremocensis]